MDSPLRLALEAMKAHVVTSRHAEMLFEVLGDALGDQGVLWTANHGRLRKLYRRDPLDPTLVIPWPVALLSLGGRAGWVSPTVDVRTGETVPEREPPPGKPSKLRGLGPAEIEVYDGPGKIGLLYGDTGGIRETTLDDRLPCRLGEIPVAVDSGRAPPVESIANCLALLDPGVYGPGRVQMPVPVPAGAEGTWQTGLAGARRALFAGLVPDEARWVVVDGVSGSAVGFGATLAAAIAALEARVAASPPQPSTTWQSPWDDYDEDGNLVRGGKTSESGEAMPAETEEAVPTGAIDFGTNVRITGPTPDVPLPPITAATVPRAVIPLPASPTVTPPLGRWERTIGARGATGHVARLVRPEGFLQVGERVLWRADPRVLDRVLDEIDARSAEVDAALAEASPFRRLVRFRSCLYGWSEAREGQPAGFASAGASSGPLFDGSGLDGDREATVVRRHVKIRRPT